MKAVRIACGLAFMAALNLGRLALTWRLYQFDGMEQIGFPFVFVERGGPSLQVNWDVPYLAADVVIAIAGALVIAHIFRNGWMAAFRRLQTWGQPESSSEFADHDSDPSESTSNPEPKGPNVDS